MCGIAGVLTTRPDRREAVASTARAMGHSLAHRGPDDDGVWVDEGGQVGLAHRRLSILDLSPSGAQPMTSGSGRYTAVYNGEVYNWPALRADLERLGHAFRGHSDTEVLLAGFEAWGVAETARRSVGMFAVAVWDRDVRALTLVRDRMGQKPLYYGWSDGAVLFGSELKALRACPGFRPEVDRGALALYFMYQCVPGPHTIYRGVRHLPPGALVTLPVGGLAQGEDLSDRERAYWSLSGAVEAGRVGPFVGSESDAEDALDRLLSEAVCDRMVADVPVGAFLSGGLDSTAVVAAAQRVTPTPVKTFTIGFSDRAYDESPHAEAVAHHLGTDHETFRVEPDDALAVIPRLARIYDEPFADSSQIPTTIVSELARSRVAVALSGDGGDELFGGYERHLIVPRLWDRIRRVPRPVRAGLGRAIRSVPPGVWDRAYAAVEGALPPSARVPPPGRKAHRLGQVLASRSPDHINEMMVRTRSQVWPPVLGVAPPLALVDQRERWPGGLGVLDRMLYVDAMTYLPDDILTKVDRATMSASLEGRAPFMDHRLVEFAWTLPESMKVRGGQGKWLLRRVVDRSVPRELMDRPKAGFGIPVGDWLRGPLRAWAEALLDPERVRSEGYLDSATVDEVWQDHLTGRADRRYEVWSILMFQAWLETADLSAPCGSDAPGSA